MTNAEKFQKVFGYYATEMWAKPEKEFLEWINAEALNQEPSCRNTRQVDLISRQAAIDALDDIRYTDRQDWWAVLSTVENLPSVQPKRGKWIKKEHLVPLAWDAEPFDWDKYDEKTHSELKEHWHCSECGYEGDRYFRPSWNYCPNCGARMESDDK